MSQVKLLSGRELRDMFVAATDWLEKNAPEVDALNVFPVPDGDTGTNMTLTMRSTLEEAFRAPDHSTSAVAEAIAKGALMGARGNSGVILSQIWHGLAKGLAGKELFTGRDFAKALTIASMEAYKGIDNPVEGTILTVAKDMAAAARSQVDNGEDDIMLVVEAAVKAGRESVANTPNLLAVLKEAGVVDAGGQGLYTILEGALHYLKGEVAEAQLGKPGIIVSNVPMLAKTAQMMAADENPYGYCTSFIIKGQELDPDKIRLKLKKKGESLIVVGDKSVVRIHIHSLDPGGVLHMATSLGTVHHVSIQNMDEQHQDFVEAQQGDIPAADIGVIAVVSGEGLASVFTSLGVMAVVPGGRTMNPSTKDLLQAVEAVASDKVIILPNNKNVILAARQVQALTEKTVKIMPTRTIPQGIAALLAFNSELDMETNLQAMKKARLAVKSIAIARAARSTQLGKLQIKRRQPIGFLDGRLVAVADSLVGVLAKTLARLDLAKAEVITVYYQNDSGRLEIGPLIGSLREKYPQLQIELLRGEQPHYNYIVSVE
ncbi:MAG: DAK2 domain-containing protein [Dehalococcoidales bacterium]|nr:DAK2 domain-containing protein [Dehalococcoidales bacterium]